MWPGYALLLFFFLSSYRDALDLRYGMTMVNSIRAVATLAALVSLLIASDGR